MDNLTVKKNNNNNAEKALILYLLFGICVKTYIKTDKPICS